MYPDNGGDDTQLTNLDCQSEFLNLAPLKQSASAEKSLVQASLCTRAYVDMPGLFDVLLLATQNQNTRVYSVHFALAGVSRELADAFTRKFLTSLGWN